MALNLGKTILAYLQDRPEERLTARQIADRKSTRLNSSH